MSEEVGTTERVIIDSKYTYEYSDGRVNLLRHGEEWITNPEGAKAWIAAAGEIERLRAERTAAHADNATCASCTHEYVADLERRLEEAEADETD